MAITVTALLCATLLLLAYKPPAIALRIVAIFETREGAPTESLDVPTDLLSLIQSRYPRNPGQEWAFDGAVESVREMYQTTKNWDVVRQQFANAA